MSAKQGAALQNYNNELVKCLEDLCERRAKLQADICQDEREKQSLEAQMNQIRERLGRVQSSLDDKMKTLAQYDRTISDTQDAYMKILESSQVLLSVVKKETQELQKSSK